VLRTKVRNIFLICKRFAKYFFVGSLRAKKAAQIIWCSGFGKIRVFREDWILNTVSIGYANLVIYFGITKRVVGFSYTYCHLLSFLQFYI
jgi:hypothetical protein